MRPIFRWLGCRPLEIDGSAVAWLKIPGIGVAFGENWEVIPQAVLTRLCDLPKCLVVSADIEAVRRRGAVFGWGYLAINAVDDLLPYDRACLAF